MVTTSEALVEIRIGDLLEANVDYIAHQCNCVTVGQGAGIARLIFAKYPDANTYTRNSIRVCGEIYATRRVINMCAQYYPGKYMSSRTGDNEENRLKWFKECLSQIGIYLSHRFSRTQRQAPFIVGFPYMIGCGLAGGEWEYYFDAIEEFAANFSQVIKVVIYKLPEI